MSEVAWRRGAKRRSKGTDSNRCSSSSLASLSVTFSSKIVEVKNVVRLTIRRSCATILPINEITKSKDDINEANEMTRSRSRSFMGFFAPSCESDNTSQESFSSSDSQLHRLKQRLQQQRSCMTTLREAWDTADSDIIVTQDRYLMKNTPSNDERISDDPHQATSLHLNDAIRLERPTSEEWINHLDCSMSFVSSNASSNHLDTFIHIRKDEDVSEIFNITQESAVSSALSRLLRLLERWLLRLVKDSTRCKAITSYDLMKESNTALPSQPSCSSIGYHEMLFITDVLLQQAKEDKV